jgi:hypothetical protein
MQLSADIIRIVGQYVVETYADLELLFCAGWRQDLTYPHAMSLVRLHIPHPENLFECVPAAVLSGVHQLTMDSCSDKDLTRLLTVAPKLQDIDLGSCSELTSTEALAQFKQLQAVRMQLCTSCSNFARGLTQLKLNGCSPIRGDLSDLHTLKLHGCVIANITHMNQGLQSLDLRNTQWSFRASGAGWTLNQLHELTALRELKLSHCDTLKNANAAGIAGMKDLHTLCLIDCFSLDDFSFIKELANLRVFSAPLEFDWALLQYLNLESLSLRSNADHLYMIATQTNLRSLSVRWWSHLFNSPDISRILSELISRLPLLHTLDVSNWSAVHDLPTHLNLRNLIVDNCQGLGNTELQTLMHSFPHLVLLSMSRTSITDAGLAMLHSSLQHLNISACQVTDSGLHSLCTNLKSLDISDCNVTPLLVPHSVTLLGLNKAASMDYATWLSLRQRGVQVVDSKTFKARLGFGM